MSVAPRLAAASANAACRAVRKMRGPVINAGRNQLWVGGVKGMKIDQLFHKIDGERAERSRSLRGGMALQCVSHLCRMALMQGAENRLLVGEVLIQRANADARDLGNAVRRDRVGAVSLENERHGSQHVFDRLACAGLPRCTAGWARCVVHCGAMLPDVCRAGKDGKRAFDGRLRSGAGRSVPDVRSRQWKVAPGVLCMHPFNQAQEGPERVLQARQRVSDERRGRLFRH